MLDRPCSHTVHECWLPTPVASFPFTSPPVLRRVPSDSVSTLARVWVDHLTCGIGMSRVAEKGERNKGTKEKTTQKKDGVG